MDSTRDIFWVGLETTPQHGGSTLRGPLFVEHLRPAVTPRPTPVVLVHGGGSQGTDWLATPDGRPGWASLLLDDGFEVYVVDRPGHGRSALHPDVLGAMTAQLPLELAQFLFAPQAGSQWPGSGQLDDPVLLALAAAFGPSLADPQHAQILERARAEELLDRIGPAILMTHSGGRTVRLAGCRRPPAAGKGDRRAGATGAALLPEPPDGHRSGLGAHLGTADDDTARRGGEPDHNRASRRW